MHDLCMYSDHIEALEEGSTECKDGGTLIDGIPDKEMMKLYGVIPCVEYGANNFLEMKRPDPYTYKCPDKHVPCSEETDANETICALPGEIDDVCPIIDLFFV